MPQTATELVARRVAELRRAHGWTAQRLAEELAKVGIPWDRYTVRNLERGRRRSLTVDEMFALAYVLDVAPVNLLATPNDATPETRISPIPIATVAPVTLRAWIRGQSPLPGQDARRYYTEVADEEWQPPDPHRIIGGWLATPSPATGGTPA